MSDLTRIEIKLSKTEFMARGTQDFVAEMFQAYVRIYKQCYGHYPFFDEDDDEPMAENVVPMKDTGKDK